MAEQTAVDWLVNKIYRVIPNEERDFLEGLREQAEQIEKENIIEAWDKRCIEGTFIGGWHIETKSGEEYYNEQFKNK